jgi:ribosomal protein S18 acetylase RimI-like enzyme
MPNIHVRRASRTDAALIVTLIHELATEEGLEAFVHTTVDHVLTHAFGDSPTFEVLLAELDGNVVGYASYLQQLSIWTGTTYLNLDDLYVRRSARSAGVGQALMHAFGAECLQRGTYGRWEVRAENARAIAFYDRLGARLTAKHICTWPAEAIRRAVEG